MPPRKVYGKSRSNYDPLAVFDSPQRPAAYEDGKRLQNGKARKALGDLNVNRVPQVALPTKEKFLRLQKPRKVIVEDSEDKESEDDQESHDIRSIQESHPRNDVRLEADVETQNKKRPQPHAETLPVIDSGDSAVPTENEYTRHCSELLELSSHGITTYAEWSEQLSNHFEITKIAEASFSEVYRLSLLQEYSDLTRSDESVFKVIPLHPPEPSPGDECRRARASTKTGYEGLSSPGDVANEVRLLLRMNDVPGYTNFRDIRIVQGRPPQPFIKAYKEYNTLQKKKRKDLSLFPDPSKKNSYTDDQLWAVIEMQDAGTDLEQLVEAGNCTSMFLIWDMFWQTVLSLAKGEEAAEFEHRDLHLGNICVRMPSQKPQYDLKRKLNFTGVETTIIDYTISRALMEDGAVAYHDLTTESGIFDGDSTEEYQYEIYRYMRGAVLSNDPYATFSALTQPSNQPWQQSHPISNLIWLHFILYKLLEQVDWPSARKQPPRSRKEEHKQWKRENDLEHILLRVSKLLDMDRICQSLIESASDLVGLALREGWLDEEDVLGQSDESRLAEGFEGLEVSTIS